MRSTLHRLRHSAPRALAPALLPLLLLCGVGAPEARGAPAGRGWTYTVALSGELDRMDVRVCFRDFPAERLVLGRGEAAEHVRALPKAAGEAGLEPDPRGGWRTVGLGPDGCLRYQVDVQRLAPGRRRDATRIGQDIVLAPTLWLLRPALWPDDALVTVDFDLPPGVVAAVPWPRIPGPGARDDAATYRLSRHVSDGDARVAFGRFGLERIEAAGATFDLAVLDAPHRATRAGIRRWLVAAAGTVGAFYGGFPVPDAVILVQPVPGRGEPVLFGQSMRAGGATVHLLLANTATDDELPGEWVAIHELIHLGVPWTHESEGWLTEGFVMYYTEILRARGGFVDERGGWQLLHDGFGRGRRGPTRLALEEQSARMHQDHAYQRVYWGGASIALLCDLAIRQTSEGRRSLDDVLRHWRERLLGTGPHNGLALLDEADRWLGRPVCGPIARRILSETAFTDLGEAYAALGLADEGGRVVYREGAPLADLRRAIMSPSGR